MTETSRNGDKVLGHMASVRIGSCIRVGASVTASNALFTERLWSQKVPAERVHPAMDDTVADPGRTVTLRLGEERGEQVPAPRRSRGLECRS